MRNLASWVILVLFYMSPFILAIAGNEALPVLFTILLIYAPTAAAGLFSSGRYKTRPLTDFSRNRRGTTAPSRALEERPE